MDIQIDYCWTDCFVLALLFLLVPLDWLFAAVTAACFHEICHILSVISLKGRIYKIRIGRCGAVLEAVPLDPVPELVCILSGPAGSLMLLTLSEWFPRLALCGMIQGAYNLLPVYPLDGGRALYCLVGLLFTQDDAARFCNVMRCLFLSVLLLTGLVGIFAFRLGVFSVFATLLLGCRAVFGKIPCNAGKLGVQYSYHI